MLPTMKLRILSAAALALLLGLAFFVPAANAATCVGEGPTVCVNRGPCYGVGASTGATDFYPGAGVCKLPPGGAFFCGRAYAGVGTLGGFYGPNVHTCVLGGATITLCVGALGNNVDPVCL